MNNVRSNSFIFIVRKYNKQYYILFGATFTLLDKIFKVYVHIYDKFMLE